MFQRWRDAGLIVPTLLTLVVLPVLIGLGTWQWYRLQWKEDLIARLEARRLAEPVSYVSALGKFVNDGDVEYLRVRLSGTFDHNVERHLYAPTTRAQGWHIYTLLQPEGGLPPIFVNRGWVPNDLKDSAKRSEGQIGGSVTVTGLVRPPQVRGYFAPLDDAVGNQWYTRDADAMRWSSKSPPTLQDLALSNAKAVAPFTIDAEAEPANPGGWPKGGTTEVRLPNNHLQYVLTWYGLALTLIGVFVAFARQRLAELDREDLQP